MSRRARAVRACLPALLVAAALSGCQDSETAALRFGLAAAPITLDPRLATDAASSRINRLLHRALVGFDARLRPRPDLARWQALDERHYRFELIAPPARFADGSALTARDVVATYRTVLAEDSRSPHRGSLSNVERVEALDERTVDFYLRGPDRLFPGRLTVGVLPASLIAAGHRFERDPRGAGPFQLVAWPDENRLRLRRRRDGLEVEFVRVRDPNVRALKLVKGEIQLLQGDLPWELSGWLAGHESIHVLRSPGTTFAYIGFNLADPVAGDVRVRRAIAHALDRASIVAHLLGGAARQASSMLPPGHWAAADDLEPIAYSPGRARALLRELGHGPDRPLVLSYKTSSDPQRLRLATVIQSQLASVGIEIDLRSYDWGTFYGDIKSGRFQMYSLAWVGVKMPDIFQYTMHSDAVPPDGANRGRYSNPRVDALIERAVAAPDEAAQASLFRAVQQELHRDLPYVPLWYEDYLVAHRNTVQGYRPAPDGGYDGLDHVRFEPGR